uniref:Putative secreted protein n=1 Tax=Anopheles marajoara TaxID=58244 RepID=A0A2M4C7D7_9DIPT
MLLPLPPPCMADGGPCELLLLPWLSWFGVTASREDADTSSGLFESLPPLEDDEDELLMRLSAEKLFFSTNGPPLDGGVSAFDAGGYLRGPPSTDVGGRYLRSWGCVCGNEPPPNPGWCACGCG